MASALDILLRVSSIAVSNPQSTFPVFWVTETVSQTIIAAESPAPVPSESPILSAVIPAVPLPHPLEIIIPFLSSAPPPTQLSPAPTTTTTTELLTVTETLTVTVSASSSTSTSAPSPSPSPTSTWRAPAGMDDLSAFNISKFSGGRRNLEIVQRIPASAIDPNYSRSSDDPPGWDDDDDDSGPTLQLFYPAGSINPAQRPVGGAQFYATPLDLTGARNVTLQYSVFFPVDFSWVLAGKLPGLYGGHAGCSGGSAAHKCFSTRMMWRKHGLGELYLYAPKDKQTEDLCADPQSVCDAAYGFSIGRGSFTWARGAWTTVQQTVTLNTPGEQDGSFTLDVNGERVLERNDIYYRGVPPRKVHTITKHSGLGGLLGTLLSDLLRRAPQTETEGGCPAATPTGSAEDAGAAFATPDPMYQVQREWAIPLGPTDGFPTTTTSQPQQPTAPPSIQLLAEQKITIQTEGEPVGFTGLFFSTFFGGHDYRYATPRDQYVWFKDFAMSYNS